MSSKHSRLHGVLLAGNLSHVYISRSTECYSFISAFSSADFSAEMTGKGRLKSQARLKRETDSVVDNICQRCRYCRLINNNNNNNNNYRGLLVKYRRQLNSMGSNRMASF